MCLSDRYIIVRALGRIIKLATCNRNFEKGTISLQVREENPILYSHKTQLNIKLSLLQQHVSA